MLNPDNRPSVNECLKHRFVAGRQEHPRDKKPEAPPVVVPCGRGRRGGSEAIKDREFFASMASRCGRRARRARIKSGFSTRLAQRYSAPIRTTDQAKSASLLQQTPADALRPSLRSHSASHDE